MQHTVLSLTKWASSVWTRPLLLLAAMSVMGQYCQPSSNFRIAELSFTPPNDEYNHLGWDLPWPGDIADRLTWERTRRYPVWIWLSSAAPQSFDLHLVVKAEAVGTEYVVGRFVARFAAGDIVPEVTSAANRGAHRTPSGATDIVGAFWLGCTNEGEVRGNAGQGPPIGADVTISVESSSLTPIGGEVIAPRPPQHIGCVLTR